MLLKHVHLAEDAAWEALYKAYKGYGKFRGRLQRENLVYQQGIIEKGGLRHEKTRQFKSYS